MSRRWIVATALAATAAAGAAAVWTLRAAPGPTWRLVPVERGEIVVTVTATGTVQPVTQVQVGTQVTGTVQKLFADFNSRVQAGDVVAQIDPAPFQARVDQDRANVARAEADVERVKAGLEQARKELDRSRELAKRELISAADLDASVAAYDSLAAQRKVAEAVVAQSRAALAVSEVNLRYTTIVSPIDGIAISRNVDVGQTVAASLQAPTLFVIADNLKDVQIQASVAEADIGRLVVGQEVRFTVDAHRDVRFAGKVAQIRLAPATVQNVVTYPVIVTASNPEEKLLPGMTASVVFEVARVTGVLKVPAAALRFVPPAPPGEEERPGGGAARGRKPPSRVWTPGPGGPAPVPVVTGATDGSWVEIVKGDLAEGRQVISGIIQDGRGQDVTNPFIPSRTGTRGVR